MNRRYKNKLRTVPTELLNYTNQLELEKPYLETFFQLQSIKELHQDSQQSSINAISPQLLQKALKMINISQTDSISHEQLSQQFSKLFIKMEFGQLIIGQLILNNGFDEFLILIIQGTVELQAGQYCKIKTNDKSDRKRNIRISHSENCTNQLPPMTEINNFYQLRAVTTGHYIILAKKTYCNFVEWVSDYLNKILIQLISQSLGISAYDVKLHKLLMIIIKQQFVKGDKVQLNKKNLIIIQKGSLKLSYLKNKNQKDKRFIILQKGCVINNRQQGNILYLSAQVLQPTKLIILDGQTIDELYLAIPSLQKNINIKTLSITKNRLDLPYYRFSQQINDQICHMNFQSIQSVKRFNQNKKDRQIFKKQQKRYSCKLKDSSTQTIAKEDQSYFTNYFFEKITESRETNFNKQIEGKTVIKQERIKNYLQKSRFEQKRMTKKKMMLRIKNLVENSQMRDSFRRVSTEIPSKQFMKNVLFDEDFQNNSRQQNISNKDIFLATNDTGILRNFLNNSRVYQKEISCLLKQNNNQSRLSTNKVVTKLLKKASRLASGILKSSNFQNTNNTFNLSIASKSCISNVQLNNKTIMKRSKSGKFVKAKISSKIY